MRLYEIHTNHGTFKIQSDEILYRDDFLRITKNEPLCLFRDKQVIAIFKDWISFNDITEKQALNSI